ncbi:MAG: protein kinase [Fuerstiella sp.]|nr:protein kinase [Fuerstiella sp.]MCP4858456.1 protein kinase [Fuerstiella sp.]
MNDPSLRNPVYQPLTDQQLSVVDDLCDRFDRELVNGTSPRIEDFLTSAPESARKSLLAELLSMELEYRAQQNDQPAAQDYAERFPDDDDVITNVFRSDDTTQIGTGIEISSFADSVPADIGNFRLIEEVGRGGMGIVWLAEQHQPVRRRVALKLIKAELTSKDVIARFAAEKQALAMMDHANIARVLDAGTTNDDRPYFVMELVDGIPITQYCDDNKLSVDERLKLSRFAKPFSTRTKKELFIAI